jgi:Flp pilus assembly protein TadD
MAMLLAGCAAPAPTSPPPSVAHVTHKTRKSAPPTEQASPDQAQADTLSTDEEAYKDNSADPAIALRYAQALRVSGRLQRAAIVLDPFVQEGQADNAPILAEYASTQAAMSNYPDAEHYARKAIAVDPANGLAYHVLGIALDAAGKHDQAEIAYRKALANWQGDPAPVLNNLGLNLAAQGYMSEAVATLKKAVELDPDRKEFQRNLRIVTAMEMQSPPSEREPQVKPGAKPAH